MTPITGGCLCRRVRFRITAAPIAMRLCWCRDCQYFAAGHATVNVVLPSHALTVEGELTDSVSIADSGSRMHRLFFPACGTPVFIASEARTQLVIVRNGALDDTGLLTPTATIWTASAPEWAWIDDAHPRFEGQPPPVA